MKIHQIKTRYSNTYVIEDEAKVFVVDVAFRCDGFVLRQIEDQLGYRAGDVALVACTHDDPDHIGGALPLAKACRAMFAIPHASRRPHLKLLRNPLGPLYKTATSFGEALRPRAREMYLSRKRAARYKHVSNAHLGREEVRLFVPPRQRLTNGMRLPGFPGWKIIHTPGHSWDSICFFHEETGSLISGDTLLGSAKRGELVHPTIYGSPAHRRLSMRRLRELAPRRVYPGHGSIMAGDDLLERL